ncbi:hypothetical protein ACFL6T_04615 [Candidatus Zixiibacteriota bacterium]
MKSQRGTPIFMLLVGMIILYPGSLLAQGRGGDPAGHEYSVATLAPWNVTVPPIVLENDLLHALLVDLAAGTSPGELRRELGLDVEELETLFRLIEAEGLGRQTNDGGWIPLSLALTSDEVARLRVPADRISLLIADLVETRWSEIDSLVSLLPVAGRLPLEQTGFLLLGDYLLGLFQYEALWSAGLAPTHRQYAFRVYQMDPSDAPPGHHVINLGSSGWQQVSFSSVRHMYGFSTLYDPESPLRTALLGDASREAVDELVLDLVNAYRLWYLMDTPPDGVTRQLLRELEVIDEMGRLRVPLISRADIQPMRSLALGIGESLWPSLVESLPEIRAIAVEMGYGDQAMLGEITLAVWEMAVHEAMHLLIDRGMVLPPTAYRAQALLVRSNW